jgi:signal transduction histidine kinase
LALAITDVCRLKENNYELQYYCWQAITISFILNLKRNYYMYYGLLALIVALVAVIFTMQYRFNKRMQAKELNNLRNEKELKLLQVMIQAEQKERARIAKELHDGIAGMLAAVKMHFSTGKQSDLLGHTAEGQQGMHLLNAVAHEIRRTAHNLVPEALLQGGLDNALCRLCRSFSNNKTIRVEYDSWGEIDRYEGSFELSVFRIVSQILNYAVKHSKASQVIVQLTQQEDYLSVSIEDDGVGLIPGYNLDDESELMRLKTWILAINGEIDIEASVQKGVNAYLEFDVSELKMIDKAATTV